MSDVVPDDRLPLADPTPGTGLSWQRLLEQEESHDPLHWLALVRTDQFKRWQRGERVPIETYLEQVARLRSDPEALLDLIFSEVLIREELGEKPTVEEYARRFPQLDSQLRLQFDVCKIFQSEAVPGQTQPTGEGATIGLPIVPGYEVRGELGRGGMGVVYRAIQKATKRAVALKVLLHGRQASARQRWRFEREIDLVASLRHPNIVGIYDSGTTVDGWPYFVMEFIDGTVLDSYLKAGEPKPLTEVLRLFATICAAVQYAHQRGIIHRDLKPANILVEGNRESGVGSREEKPASYSPTPDSLLPTPKITDFGLAKTIDEPSAGDQDDLATRTGEFLGTLAYASPEQAACDTHNIDTRTDVYSLGVMLYEALTGRLPYPIRGSILQIVHTIRETEPEPLQRRPHLEDAGQPRPKYPIDSPLEAIVLKALAKDRDRRYQSANALAEDLTHYLAGEPIQARPPSLTFLLRMWWRQNFRAALWTILVGVACGLLSATAYAAVVIPPMMRDAAATYRQFSSLRPPWLANDLVLSPWTIMLLGLFGLAAFVGMGFYTVLLVRPKDRSADVLAGLATGLSAGITAFTLSLGWAAVLAVAVNPSVADVELLGQASPEAIPAKYPELADVPQPERGQLLAHKILIDTVVGIPSGIWLGMLLALGVFSIYAVCGTMAAGNLIRRGNRIRDAVLPYLELTLPSASLIVELISQILVPTADRRNVLLLLVLAVLAYLGVSRRWHVLVRLSLYAGWTLNLLWVLGVDMPRMLVVGIDSGLLLLLLAYRIGRRRFPSEMQRGSAS